MKRNLDLVRTILLEVEAHATPATTVDIKAPGHSPEEIDYHVRLLHQAGLIDAHDARTMEETDRWLATSLTWRGHEFLDATRNDTVWHKVKAELKDRGVALPFDLLQKLALAIMAKHIGLK